MEAIIKQFTELLNQEIIQFRPLSGGDISQAYQITTSKQTYFLKQHDGPLSIHMFEAEKKALETIATTNSIAVPKVYAVGSYDDRSYILMEFIASKRGTPDDFRTLASHLATMHSVHFQKFGFEEDNFIGSLPQSNKLEENWNDFYLNERLKPQIEMAVTQGLLTRKELPNLDRMHQVLFSYFKDVRPSLLHGDLWSGNFLFGLDGTPYLIDPAVYYGHCEVDIAMTHLFGGFHGAFYEVYYEIVPHSNKTEARIALYQLYYLLVHLNLFGSSYKEAVRRILNHYF